VPPLSPFANDAVRPEHHQVLGNPRLADTYHGLQRFHVALAIPQLLNDADAVRVRQNRKEGGKLLGDQKSVRHGSLPFCHKVQTFEY
jgi:hypothetical protein